MREQDTRRRRTPGNDPGLGTDTFSLERAADGLRLMGEGLSHPEDQWEREAEQASSEGSMASAAPERELASPRPIATPTRPSLPPPVASAVAPALAGGGQPLEPEVREELEPRFGHDFSRIRIHTDHAAGESARGLGARAYSFGPDLIFQQGEYAPGTSSGRQLLSHELAHVVQQSGGGPGLSARPTAGPDAVLARQYYVLPNPDDEPPVPTVPNVTTPTISAKDWSALITPVTGDITTPWQEGPNIRKDPALDQNASAQTAINTFVGDWTKGQTAWNQVGGLVLSYREAAKKAAEEGLAGPATPNNPEGVIRKPADTSLDAGQAVEQGRPVGTESKVKIGDLFNGGELKKDVETPKMAFNDELDKKVNAVTADAQRELLDSFDEVSKANNDLKNKALSARNAYAGIAIKKAEKESSDSEAYKMQVERERAVVLAGFDMVMSGAKAGASYLGARAEGKSVEAAAAPASSDPISAVVHFFVGGEYDQEIFQITAKLQAAKTWIAQNQQNIAENDFERARLEFENQKLVVNAARRKLEAAHQKRRDALKDLATQAKANAAKGGASKQVQDQIDTAIRALPAVEYVLSRISNIVDKVQLPTYSESSGFGAAMAENLPSFVSHLGILAGTGAEFKDLKGVWEARLKEIEALIRNLHSSNAP